MRIAQIAPVWERVPPKRYGGTERIVYLLTEELVKRGHEVTLFASGDSITSAKLVSVTPKHLRALKRKDIYNGLNELNVLNFAAAYEQQEEFDIIHDHNGPMSLPTANISKTPVVYTLHYIAAKEVLLWGSLTNPHLVAISNGEIKKDWSMKSHAVVYHGLEMNHYPFSKTPENYLLFVGRMHPDKGLHNAIKVAKKLNMRLLIAARFLKDIKVERDYFEKYIKKHLADPRIKYIGEVDEKRRNKLMSKAYCVLHPVSWPEPFGLTMIEAMACGTPVIAFRNGSIPEVVLDGKNGFIVENAKEMAEAVKKIPSISREFCREYSLANFSVKRMVDQYEALYLKVIETSKLREQNKTTKKVLKELIETKDSFKSSPRPFIYTADLRKK